MNNEPRFTPGTLVQVTSPVSKNRGRTGVIQNYCRGRYANICNVLFKDLTTARFFDTNLEAVSS